MPAAPVLVVEYLKVTVLDVSVAANVTPVDVFCTAVVSPVAKLPPEPSVDATTIKVPVLVVVSLTIV